MSGTYYNGDEKGVSMSEFSFASPVHWDPQGITSWSEHVALGGDQLRSLGVQLDHDFPVSNVDFLYDDELYDQSSYMAHNIPIYKPTPQRPSAEMIHHKSTSLADQVRRHSNHSLAASCITRPMSAYADSSYYNSSAAISPILSSTDHSFYQGQELYSPNASEIFDLAAYATSVEPHEPTEVVPTVGLSLDRSVATSSPPAVSDEDTSSSQSAVVGEYVEDVPPRSHVLYQVLPSADGYFHCPFAESESCGHEPKQLKCEYDKHIDSHLKPFKCKNQKCRDLQFSSTACLLRHEREAHEMHGHAESLCEYPPCSRSVSGHGFRRSYNCKDHMTRCHGWVDNGPADPKKRRSVAYSSSVRSNGVSKGKSRALSKKQQIAKLRQEYCERKSGMESLVAGLEMEGPLAAMRMTQIQTELQTLGAIMEMVHKLEGRTGSSV